jgi:hypothetical protein
MAAAPTFERGVSLPEVLYACARWLWLETRYLLWWVVWNRKKITFVDPVRHWLVRGHVWSIGGTWLEVVRKKTERIPVCELRRDDRDVSWLPGHVFDRSRRAALLAAYRLSASDERGRDR